MSEETKEKIRLARSGKKLPPRTEEWSDKISAAKKGHTVSEETRRKISASLKAKRGD